MFLNQRLVGASSMGIDLQAGNAEISVLTPEALERLYGIIHGPGRGLRFHGLVLKVADLDALRAVLAANSVLARDETSRIVVSPATGQGLVLAFEASA